MNKGGVVGGLNTVGRLTNNLTLLPPHLLHLAVKHTYLQHGKHRVVKQKVQNESHFVFFGKQQIHYKQQHVKHKLKHSYAQKLGNKSLRPALCRAQQKKMNNTNRNCKNTQQHIAVLHDKLSRCLLVKNRLPCSAGKGNG